MMVVFLGGTCNGSEWRDKLIPMLKMDYYNPVVEDWTSEQRLEELKQRDKCDICVYVITPRMLGCYSIAEVIDDSNKRPEKTVLCILDIDYSVDMKRYKDYQERFLLAVSDMVTRNGGVVFYNLESLANYLNSKYLS